MKIRLKLPRCIIIVGILLASPFAARGESPDPGKAAYLRYCSACHGESGKGDGVVSQLMRPKPSDLTAIAKANKGAFPSVRVMTVIDGRETMSAHGDPAMPVWGELLKVPEATSGEQTVTRGKVMLITEYLRTIQQP